MNRTRALIIIGGFMLVLAVLAALELRREDAVVAEGQMVTGSIASAPKNVLSQNAAGERVLSSSGGTPVSLAGGTARSQQEVALPVPAAPAPSVSSASLPSASGEVIAPLAAPAPQTVPLRGDKIGEKPVPGVPAKPLALQENTSPAKSAQPENRAETQQKREPAKSAAKERPEAKQSERAPEARPLILTTKAPAKLQGKQKAITQTRLELGKNITFRLTGAAPMSAKTLLLASPDRYVVDLQGEWGIALPKVPRNLLLQEIRVGQRENATRLVFGLKRKPESAQVVKIDAQTLEVRIR